MGILASYTAALNGFVLGAVIGAGLVVACRQRRAARSWGESR